MNRGQDYIVYFLFNDLMHHSISRCHRHELDVALCRAGALRQARRSGSVSRKRRQDPSSALERLPLDPSDPHRREPYLLDPRSDG